MALELRADDGLRSDQHDTHIMVPCCLNGTLDLRFGRPVRTHRVQSYDAWHGMGLAGFFDFKDFTALVVAALGAGTMRHLALVAVWTLRQRVPFQCIMGTPCRGALFGVSSFRIRHGFLLNSRSLRELKLRAAEGGCHYANL